MSAETFVVILLSLAVVIISGSMWMLVQDFREVRRSVLMLEAKAEQTEPSSSEIPNNSKVSEIPTGSEIPNNCDKDINVRSKEGE